MKLHEMTNKHWLVTRDYSDAHTTEQSDYNNNNNDHNKIVHTKI